MRMLDLKIPPALLLLLAAALMWIVTRKTPGLAIHVPAARAVASGCLLAGFALGLASVISFRKARTTLNPTRPNATSALVTTGVFAISRNPIYLGMFLLLVSWAVVLQNAAAFLLLPLFILYMNRFQITPEEKALSSHFGADFEGYKRRVRRWI